MSLIRPLDKYVLREFLGIFAAAALGFPILVIVLDMAENLGKYLQLKLPMMDIAQAYFYGTAETMFMILPAAVLFATVFSIGAFTRHAEITAAKASGISFHRFILPIVFGALVSMVLGLAIGAMMPEANARRDALLKERQRRNIEARPNFTYVSEDQRVYKIGFADALQNTLQDIEIERRGGQRGVSELHDLRARRSFYAHHAADESRLDAQGRCRAHHTGRRDELRHYVRFAARQRFREPPRTLMADPRAPDEMGFTDLGVFIKQMERSGTDVNKFRTARMLKLAIPVTCVIIMLFGAPLATSTQRSGPALGVGISLATTVIFLMLVQLTQAIGDKGLMMPELAAWIPSAVFGILGTVLLVRVRT